ncbi:MAG: site-2 protease family protein [Bacteroidetes bacterium]|nr:site-2 protease family protein [Bacteroidota bacterium]
MLWQNQIDLAYVSIGIPYAVAALFILGCHEFGHYFAAKHHRVRVTLPYFIPLPPLPQFINFGTLGAVIRTRQQIPNRTALFDIGIAGPLAGFVASIIVLIYGFMTLPGHDFLLAIHPDYDFSTGMAASAEPGYSLTFGRTLLYGFMEQVFSRPGAYVPPMTEMYHYPFLITGWFGLLVTALNLLPAGQLDGGHITYAMFGKTQHLVGRITLVVLISLGGIGIFPAIMELAGFGAAGVAFMEAFGSFEAWFWPGWLFWALLIGVVVKVRHPEVPVNEELTPTRRLLGWLSYVIFVLSLSPAPIYLG